MKGQEFQFHYSHLLPRKPGVIPLDGEQSRHCTRCGVEFVTRARAKKRCDPCAAIVKQKSQKRANERLKARRAQAKATTKPSPV